MLFKRRIENEPVVIKIPQYYDAFEPTDEYMKLIACKRCIRTEGMTKTDDICKYCKNNIKGEQTND